jgi:hypothetical protein
MRPTPTRLPDEMLAPACRTLGIEGLPDEALLNPALRAAVQAAVRAQLAGRPARRAAPRALGVQTALGFDRNSVDIKRRAANDRDED